LQGEYRPTGKEFDRDCEQIQLRVFPSTGPPLQAFWRFGKYRLILLLTKTNKKPKDVEVIPTTCFLYVVDRMGFNIMGQDTNDKWVDVRIPWEQELKTAKECIVTLHGTLDQLKVAKF